MAVLMSALPTRLRSIASAPCPIFLGFALHGRCIRVLHFEPIGGAAGTVGGVLALRDDAFKAELASMGEDGRAVAPRASRCVRQLSKSPIKKRCPGRGGVPGLQETFLSVLDRRSQSTHAGLQGPYMEIDCYGRLAVDGESGRQGADRDKRPSLKKSPGFLRRRGLSWTA